MNPIILNDYEKFCEIIGCAADAFNTIGDEVESLKGIIQRYAYPLVGDSIPLLTNPKEFVVTELTDRAFADEEGVGMGYFGPPSLHLATMVSVTNHDLIRQVVQYGEDKDDLDPAARAPMDVVEKATGIKTLVNLQGDEASKARKDLKDHLSVEHILNNTHDTTFEQFSHFLENYDSEYSFQDNVHKLIVNIVAETVFGAPQEICMENTKLIIDMVDLVNNSDPSKKIFKDNSRQLIEFSNEYMSEHTEQIRELDRLLINGLNLSEIEDVSVLRNRLIEEHGGTSFMAGGTPSVFLSSLLAIISEKPDIKLRLKSELEDLGEITPESLESCEFLHCVYNEGLRYISATPLVARATSRQSQFTVKSQKKPGEDIVYTFPPRTYFFVPIKRIHFNEQYWVNPEEFDPSRFEIEENRRINFSKKNFYPFSIGKRSCPAGSKYVPTLIKAALAGIILNSDFTLDREVEELPEGFPKLREHYTIQRA